MHIPGGETHWHGGGSSTVMAHTAISLGSQLPLHPTFPSASSPAVARRLQLQHCHAVLTTVTETSWHEEVEQKIYDEAEKTAK